MAHELILVKGKKKQNITQLIGNLSWSSNKDALGVELSFDYAYNDSKYFKPYDIVSVGDHVVLMNTSKVISRFIVVDEDRSGRFGKSFACFDYAWYLNKNQVVIQFKKLSASQAIQKLLDKVGIKHKVTNIKTLITHIYKGETVSDIITEILEQAEQELKIKYRIEMDKDILVIRKMSDLVINPKIRLSSNTPLIKITETIGSPSHSRSIQDMYNNVQVVNGDEKSMKILASAKSAASIAHYGQFTTVVEITDKKEEAKARNIANNTLAESNKVKETISFEMLGHDDVRAGRLIDINEPITGIHGRYLINSASHTETNGIHKVSVELETV